MALREDVAALLAEAGMAAADVDEAVRDEHVRVRVYLDVVAQVAASGRPGAQRRVVALILRDPVGSVARTAIVQLVDEIASRATDPSGFRRWAGGLVPELQGFDDEGNRLFVRRRVHDWSVHLALLDGRTPTSAEVEGTTAWMQRRLAETTASLPVLDLLAGSGRTRRIRNIAGHRAGALRRRR